MITSASVVDAGRVTLPPAFRQSRDRLSLRLLHAGEYLDEGYPRFELSRRDSVGEVGDGVLMPVGLSIGAIWDERSETYVALSRPFEVKRRDTVSAPLEVPRKYEAHLVAQVQRVSATRNRNDMKVKILLSRGGRTRPPDFQVSTADRAYAMWYGLKPGPAELIAEADDAVMEPQSLTLVGGTIARVVRSMTEPPAWAKAPHPLSP